MLPRTLAAGFLALLFSSFVQADVYRWVSGDGTVQFSDVPPRDRPYSSVRLRPSATVPMGENLEQSDSISRTRADVRNMLADRPGNYARQKQARETEKRCEDYRQQLENIQSRLRAGYSNDRGNSLRQKRRVVNQAYSRECVLR